MKFLNLIIKKFMFGFTTGLLIIFGICIMVGLLDFYFSMMGM